MRNDKAHVFIYFTGPGWELFNQYNFMYEVCTERQAVVSQLGGSDAALSSALTGKTPVSHGQFSSWYFKRSNNFKDISRKLLLLLAGLPSGYFGKVKTPLRGLRHLCPERGVGSELKPHHFHPLKSIIDIIHENRIPHYIAKIHPGQFDQTFSSLRQRMKRRSVHFAFIQVDELDPLLHLSPYDERSIVQRLKMFERELKAVYRTGCQAYNDFNLSLFSGHGITIAPDRIDVRRKIDCLNLDFGHDYHAAYDPTMARFWFENSRARSIIIDRLRRIRHSHILSEDEKDRYGINFQENIFGETILLLDPGHQIYPNDALRQPLLGMHGYAPDDKYSLGAYLASTEIRTPVKWVGNFFDVMADAVAPMVNG
ncbi:hypothetical protein P0136_01395 [Lentisphaerota bacterium ZTH]|nr:hypothetical protein JYG24_07465 [Lentisphaerota bacterium]WET06669.1 hypothetical protein P0136_01395 [Lentisphaerota bacterium ZTH]